MNLNELITSFFKIYFYVFIIGVIFYTIYSFTKEYNEVKYNAIKNGNYNIENLLYFIIRWSLFILSCKIMFP